jgi:hypothetical protein
MTLHPDDVLFFHDVATAMRTVARAYRLRLTSVTALPMPATGMADRLGDCNSSGDIRLVLRCTEDGAWCPEPMSPVEVWRTAAHELAHLKHMHHGPAFQEFRLELETALQNRQQDHRDKVLARLVKMQASRDGEAALGNTSAAEAFATAINRMLIEHELNPSDIDYARASDQDPVIEVPVNLKQYTIETKKMRVAWQESLARIVARAHLCAFLLRSGSNQIWFVGTRSHAAVAEYAYGTLVPAAAKLAHEAYWEFRKELRKTSRPSSEACGFYASWLDGFIARVAQRFDAARVAAVAAAPEGASVALVRLDGALAKTRQYIDNKFKSKRGASSLNSVRATHREGQARGRAAADRMAIGRKGVGGGGVKLLN